MSHQSRARRMARQYAENHPSTVSKLATQRPKIPTNQDSGWWVFWVFLILLIFGIGSPHNH